jgi:hypothetical protein
MIEILFLVNNRKLYFKQKKTLNIGFSISYKYFFSQPLSSYLKKIKKLK